MLSTADVRAVVKREIWDLLAETGGDAAVDDGDAIAEAALHDLGLNSLMLARLVIQLEAELGVDPFAKEEAAIVDIRSVEDLAVTYERALAGAR